jgi:hypothetical protein
LNKRLDTVAFTKQGFMVRPLTPSSYASPPNPTNPLPSQLQAIAAGWHHKSPEQLKEIGDKVGRERIMVVHGTRDNMITVPHGRKLIEWLKPGVGVIKEGTGHVFMIEEELWHNEMVEGQIEKVLKLGKA